MKARVTANKGFISERMDYENAVCFAILLEELGNVNVKVVEEK